MNMVLLLKEELHRIKSVKVINKDNQIIIKSPSNKIREIIKELKNNKKLCFLQLIDITAINYPKSYAQFDLIYILLSHKHNERIILKTALKEKDKPLSVIDIFPSADWFEREVFDMFGIEFKNHYNLKKILTEDDLQGHPLMKNYPLNGEFDLFYNEESQEYERTPIFKDDSKKFSLAKFLEGDKNE